MFQSHQPTIISILGDLGHYCIHYNYWFSMRVRSILLVLYLLIVGVVVSCKKGPADINLVFDKPSIDIDWNATTVDIMPSNNHLSFFDIYWRADFYSQAGLLLPSMSICSDDNPLQCIGEKFDWISVYWNTSYPVFKLVIEENKSDVARTCTINIYDVRSTYNGMIVIRQNGYLQ